MLASEDGPSEGVNELFYFLPQRQLVLSQLLYVQGIVINRNFVKSFAGQSEVENLLQRDKSVLSVGRCKSGRKKVRDV